ncbi:MAG TPA: class I SAM-dependent methyltransferase [Rhodanobacteraceae bacterium]|nr:class I SAM-dependent methyltransferase [Rhodanobacteraceae bacterium]
MNTAEAIDTSAIHRRLAGHFADGWETRYVRGKLRIDPLYIAAEQVFRDNRLPLLDIGCGMGLLGMYLDEHGQRRDYLGVDNDPRKIASATAIVARHYPNMRFMQADAGSLPEFAGNVALLDALHYMPYPLQATVLEAAAARVAPGGILMIRNCLRDRSWRYHATMLEEKILHWTGWMRASGHRFPSREEIVGPLQGHGLSVELSPLWGRTPYNSYLVVARRAR